MAELLTSICHRYWCLAPHQRIILYVILLLILSLLLSGCGIEDRLGDLGDSIGDMLRDALGK